MGVRSRRTKRLPIQSRQCVVPSNGCDSSGPRAQGPTECRLLRHRLLCRYDAGICVESLRSSWRFLRSLRYRRRRFRTSQGALTALGSHAKVARRSSGGVPLHPAWLTALRLGRRSRSGEGGSPFAARSVPFGVDGAHGTTSTRRHEGTEFTCPVSSVTSAAGRPAQRIPIQTFQAFIPSSTM